VTGKSLPVKKLDVVGLGLGGRAGQKIICQACHVRVIGVVGARQEELPTVGGDSQVAMRVVGDNAANKRTCL
jgi:hypothetical protein